MHRALNETVRRPAAADLVDAARGEGQGGQ